MAGMQMHTSPPIESYADLYYERKRHGHISIHLNNIQGGFC